MAFRKRLQAVHVPHHKNTAGMKAETLPPPKEVLLPMNMHMGTPAVPVVSVGDYVRVGQKLARGEGSITCEVHATVSGTVLSLDPMPELFGNDLPVIRIENDGKMEVDPTLAPRTAEDLAAFVEDLHESGIVGLGGAAFPVDWKFDAALRHNVKTMLINGAECEPYVTSDNRMMLDHGEDIRRGIELLKKYVKPDNFVFAIENNKPQAIAAMKELFADDPTMSPMDALRKSKEMMRGYRWDTFVLNLSFLPWYLLGGLTCGVLNVFYITPYVAQTNAELYRALKGRRYTSEML